MSDRKTVFISKATPEDDEFVLWLAPKLEAAGYSVFADIQSLKAGDRWRKEVTAALQNNAIKMLLCCRDASLAKDGVQEEIGIALDLSKELNDKRFILPLRLQKYKKIFGIGELQYIDFVGGWANGLYKLFEELNEEGVPRIKDGISINPSWELYKQRLSINVQREVEPLTTNWIKILTLPNAISYYEPKGAIDFDALKHACSVSEYPAEIHLNGIFSFMSYQDVNTQLSSIGTFENTHSYSVQEFIKEGAEKPKIKAREASNLVVSIFRQAWNTMCRNRGLSEYAYSNQLGFHVNKNIAPIGKRIAWGSKDNRRSSMLRNKSKGKIWEYGISATPSFWPFPHFKFKSRILFSELASNEAGSVIGDVQKQHKLRRTVCSGWRNKAWHGRLMAYLKILCDSNETVFLPLSPDLNIELSGLPIITNSPVTTKKSDILDEDEDENDLTTLGNFDLEEEEP